jgi:hypothetical protein
MNGTAYNQWKEKAKTISKNLSGTRFILNDYLERNATQEQKRKGCDLADILIQEDWRKYRQAFSFC